MLFIQSCRPISEPWISENINAIIEVWEPGSFGGLAAASVFWKSKPGGKIPLTIANSVGQLKMFIFINICVIETIQPDTNKPLYSFGYGPSYTKFEISEPKLNSSKFKNDILSITVNVKNIGKISGDEIVQLYISDKYSSMTNLLKNLKPLKELV